MREVFPTGHVLNFRLNSFEEVEAQAVQWKLRSTPLEPGPYRAVLQGLHTPLLQLARTQRGLRAAIEAEIPRGTVLLGFATTAAVRLSYRGRVLADGDVAVQRSDALLEATLSGPSDVVSLCVDEAEVERRAELLWHRPLGIRAGTLAFESRTVAHATANFCVETIAAFLNRTNPAVSLARLRALESRVLDGVLGGMGCQAPAAGTLGRHRATRHAVDFLRERCREELSISDLCAATNASRRTLHLGFLELHGVPPMRYLKALRLCRARRDLARTSDPGVRVTDVATRWGFTHLGRFSAEYRAFFGECPSARKGRANAAAQPFRAFS